MESRKREILGVMLVMMLVMVQRSAADDDIGATIDRNFTICYAKCFVPCASSPVPINVCAAACLARCFRPTTSLEDNDYHCQLGCATSKCSNISTRENLAGEVVKSCVSACSQGCKRH